MANPQLEHGYLKIANEIINALAAIRISGEEWQCLIVILKKTYGFNKKMDAISLSQFVGFTGIQKPHIIRSLKKLLSKKIIFIAKKGNSIAKKGNDNCITYGFNKNYEQWMPLPKKATLPKKAKSIAKNGNKALPKMVPTKDNNIKTNIKDNIYSRDAQKILDYLNNKRGSKYKKKEEIMARLKEGYTFDNCVKVIENKLNDPYFQENPKYLNPVTLFRKSHFDNYLNETPSKKIDNFELYRQMKEKGEI